MGQRAPGSVYACRRFVTPDSQVVATQLLLAHLHTSKVRMLRTKGLMAGGYHLLRSAGLAKNQAKAVGELLMRQGHEWRDCDHVPAADELDKVIKQLLV